VLLSAASLPPSAILLQPSVCGKIGFLELTISRPLGFKQSYMPMLKSILLAALIIPAIIYTTQKEWQYLGFMDFSDEESKAYIDDFGQRMATLPDTVGDWVFDHEKPVHEGQIRVAKITKYQSRVYRNKVNGTMVSIFLSTGPRGDICIHTPIECNPAAGYVEVLPDSQTRDVYQLDESGEPKKNLGSFVWQRFRHPKLNVEREIWWSYNETGKWEGEKNPRMAFTKPGIYKIYVEEEVSPGAVSAGKKQEPPQLSFLRAFIPEANKRLFPAEKPAENKVAAK
jgi:hypothetical protein